MSNMMKSQNFRADNMIFPGYVSRKFDGVPGGYTRYDLESRQKKPLLGVQWIHDMIKDCIPSGIRIWMEHWEPNTPFKDISGKVRKNIPYQGVHGVIHNVHIFDWPDAPFKKRWDFISDWYNDYYVKLYPIIHLADQLYVEDETDMWNMYHNFSRRAAAYDDYFEGCMYHTAKGLYTPDKRSWDSRKLVKKPTVDLQVVELFEAIDEQGVNKGMVGSFLCIDRGGDTFVVSAGKSTHDERRDWWTNPNKIIGRIIVTKHKGDSSYKELREPTFQHIHEDKEEPDYV